MGEKEEPPKYCASCGSATILRCKNCNTLIPESRIRPNYCTACGFPYPWTEAAIKNATLLISEEEELSTQLKTSVIESLPDIITETPGTNLATVRVKKCLASAGKFTADAVRQFVIDFGCELAKKSLGF